MNNDITPEWEEYLSNISATPGINPTAASELLQDKDRLFVHDPAKALLETWSYSEDNKYLEKAGTSGEEDLNEYLDWSRTGDKITALNIPQVTSWSKLKITFPMFARVCHSLRLMPPFLELVSTFGYRREDSDNYFSAGFRCSFRSMDSFRPSYSHDVCYNMRFVEFHGRKVQDPWSFRNFSVYYRCYSSESSTWIFINLPKTLKDHLILTMKDAGKHDQHIAFLHLSFFKFCVTNWRRYINFLDASCQKIRKAASFVRLNRGIQPDYALDFSSCQRLGAILHDLERGNGILQSYDQVAYTVREFFRSLHEKDIITKDSYANMKKSLREQLQIVQRHKQKIEILLRTCEFVLKMLFQLLSLRNDTVLHENSKLLKEMMGISTLETKNISWLTRQTCADARGTKITTLISMAYAPAAVIAAIFSSSLIEINHGNSQQKGLMVSKEMWIFTLVTIALTLFTVGISWYLERRQKQVLNSQRSESGEETKSHPSV